MVIVMKKAIPEEEVKRLREKLESLGCAVHILDYTEHCVLSLTGNQDAINHSQIEANPYVDRVLPILPAFRLASRLFQAKDTVIDIRGKRIGGGHRLYIAGPCAVESEAQLRCIGEGIKGYADLLRGGTFKPRTSPYSFQGLEEEGLRLLQKIGKELGLPVVSEVVSPEDVEVVARYCDVIQIGARNMQNFSLLKKVGRQRKPILLKRGMAASIEEFLLSAEYIMAEGNPYVILCERGIRTFETYTRNTLDLSSVLAVHELSHLPIIVDPSHAAGKWSLVEPLARASMAAGADGLMIEVHHQPEEALSDGAQSLLPERYRHVIQSVRLIDNTLRDVPPLARAMHEGTFLHF